MDEIFLYTLFASLLGFGLTLGYFVCTNKLMLVIPLFLFLTLIIFVVEEQNLAGAIRASVYNELVNEIQTNWTLVAKNETHTFYCNKCAQASELWIDWGDENE